MSDHGHDSHSHDTSTAHDSHDSHGHGGEGEWVDYNAKPLDESTLPKLGPVSLLIIGIALATVLSAAVCASFTIK
jgi:hypothetical protein